MHALGVLDQVEGDWLTCVVDCVGESFVHHIAHTLRCRQSYLHGDVPGDHVQSTASLGDIDARLRLREHFYRTLGDGIP